jgi:glycosyltransferase involved in cell wall biosynthesis
MKILQLVKKYPFPIKDGESIAVNALSRSFAALGSEVTLLTMNTTKHFYNALQTPSELAHYQAVHAVVVDNRLKAIDAFLNLFSKDSYHVARFVSKDFNAQLQALLEKETFDVVQLETLYLAPYIPTIRKYSKAKIVMRSHNVEHEIWNRIAQNMPKGLRQRYLQLLTKRLESYEVAQLQEYDLLASISERDLKVFQTLGHHSQSIVAPIGLHLNNYQPNWEAFKQPLSLCFIGSLDWPPNVEGLKWFLDKVWPQLQLQLPGLEFHLAGRNTPDWLLQTAINGVTVHGEVPDAQDFINQYSMMVVPLFSGSGMRAKILEAMALGRLVLTTSIGLEGIAAVHDEQVLVAGSAQDFVLQIEKAYYEPDRMLLLGQRARDLVTEQFDDLNIARKLLATYADQPLTKQH